jgi:hypothetical protein
MKMDILINIISNILTIPIIVCIGIIIHHLTRRKNLLLFFNLKKDKRIVLYLSNLQVKPGGAVGQDGIPRSYGGEAIPLNEANLIPLFQKLFNFIVPSLKSQPGFLQWLLISDILVEAIISPRDENQIEKASTFISMGSPGYNSASKYIEDKFNPLCRFANGNTVLKVQGIDTPIDDLQCSFVQKSINSQSGQVAYYVAGMSALGTTGAAQFLATKWNYLSRKYPKNKPFCIVLKIASTDTTKCEILFEKE